MSTNLKTPVIVVTEEKRRRRGLWWIAAGSAALLLGGSTFALWSANDTFAGGTITAGDLAVNAVTDTTFWDVTAGRTDATETLPGTDGERLGHAIQIDDWRMVPGDTVAANLAAAVTLEGDNMVGRLSLAGLTAADNTSLAWSYEVYLEDALVASGTALPANGTLVYLSAPGDGQNGAEDAQEAGDAGVAVFPMTAKIADFTVVLYATFDAAAGDAAKDENGVSTDQSAETGSRLNAGIATALSGLTLQLDQVRDTGAVFGG